MQMRIAISRHDLVSRRACRRWFAVFDRLAPSGELELLWSPGHSLAALVPGFLGGPPDDWPEPLSAAVRWAVTEGLLPAPVATGHSLRFADLRFANLRNADLRNADLRYADLRNADLRNADLRAADLRYADLRNAELEATDLRGADLERANLRGAYLIETPAPPAGWVSENARLRQAKKAAS